jgi:hypothetical protein
MKKRIAFLYYLEVENLGLHQRFPLAVSRMPNLRKQGLLTLIIKIER